MTGYEYVIGFNTLTLRSYGITSLEGLGHQPDLECLHLQGNSIRTFEGLGSQTNLKELRLEDNEIEDYRGAEPQLRLEVLGLEGNPVARHPLYRIMALLAFSPNLRRIDNEAVTSDERDVASKLGQGASFAVRHGWLLDLKSRTEAEYRAIVQELRLQPSPAEEERSAAGEEAAASSAGHFVSAAGSRGIWTNENSSLESAPAGRSPRRRSSPAGLSDLPTAVPVLVARQQQQQPVSSNDQPGVQYSRRGFRDSGSEGLAEDEREPEPGEWEEEELQVRPGRRGQPRQRPSDQEEGDWADGWRELARPPEGGEFGSPRMGGAGSPSRRAGGGGGGSG
eukprot:RCo008587